MEGLIIPLELEDGSELKLYVPQPQADRVEACVEFFEMLYLNADSISIEALGKDYKIKAKKIAQKIKNPDLPTHLEALLQECILGIKPITTLKEASILEGIEFFSKLDDYTKDILKAMILFFTALLRYASPKTKTTSLSEFCTALSIEELREQYLKSLEETQKKSLTDKTQEG